MHGDALFTINNTDHSLLVVKSMYMSQCPNYSYVHSINCHAL
uniref:Uncharacterized protein n=1 Tax=Rhizophora mucronata TaxID=61149 RepID=A0A2P2LA46_RHIMU